MPLSSGFGILDKIEQENPDIIVLDIKLIDDDGLELLQAVKNRLKNMPVGLCTAYEPFKDDMNSIAADFYIVKSHDLTELKRSTALTLGKYREIKGQ